MRRPLRKPVEEKFYREWNDEERVFVCAVAEGTICLCCCLYARLALCFLVSLRVCTPPPLAVYIPPFIAFIVFNALCYIFNVSNDDG